MNSDTIATSTTEPGSVVLCSEIDSTSLRTVLAQYAIELHHTPANENIPGSFWQDAEAGLIANRLYVRDDTPVHSALHEACHYICMDQQRRTQLHTNAGGGYDEEDAVCYLQILLADQIPQMLHNRMLRDMDAWGYSFRLGSAQSWFEHDAEDAQQWLIKHHIIDAHNKPTGKLRID
ncbi:MAG: hypothetical protein WBN96_08055 [Gammaproteobacteria bacterium]